MQLLGIDREQSMTCHLVHCLGTARQSYALELNFQAALISTGQDVHDATSSSSCVEDFAAALRPADSLESKPLQGKRFGIIAGMMSSGLAPGVASAVQYSITHLESLGAEVEEVSCTCVGLGQNQIDPLVPPDKIFLYMCRDAHNK